MNKPIPRADSWVGSPEYNPTEPTQPVQRKPRAPMGSYKGQRRVSRELADQNNEKRLYNQIFNKAAAGQERDINKLRALDSLAEDYKSSETWGNNTLANNPNLGTMNKYVEMGLLKEKSDFGKQGPSPVKQNPYKVGGARGEPIPSYQHYSFKQIRQFFYLNLYEGEGFVCDDYLGQKRKEARALIMQLGQRRMDRHKIIDLLQSHKTLTHEKAALTEKKDFYEYLILHGYERIKVLLQDAPFSVEDVYAELEKELPQEYDYLVLDQAKQELGLDIHEPLPDVEPPQPEERPPVQQYGDNSYRLKYYKHIMDLQVRKGRKFLEIDYVDTRAIKNKLGMTALSELVELYKEYEKDGQLNTLYEQVQKALPGVQRAEKLMKKVKFVKDLETEYLDKQEKNYMSRPHSNEEYSQHSWEEKTEYDEDENLIYTYIPFWYEEIIDTAERKSKLLHKMLGLNIGIATRIYKMTNARTIDELIKVYRQNKDDEMRDGLFSDQDVKILLDSGWTLQLLDHFNWLIVRLSEDAWNLPKILFDYPKPRPDLKVLEIDDIPGLPMAAYSAIITSVLVNQNNVKGIRLNNLDLSPDIIPVIQFLVNSKEKRIIEVTITNNDLKDEGAYNLLQSSKKESLHYIKIIRLENCNLSSQGGVYISGFLKEASYIQSFMKLQYLSLKQNNIGNTGFETLFFALRGNTSLQYLDLSYNKVSDIGLHVVFDALKYNTALQILYVNGNRFNNTSITQTLDDPATTFTNSSLLILKLGIFTAMADNIGKLIRKCFPSLTKLRYCEIIAPTVNAEDNVQIAKIIQTFPNPAMIKVLTKDPPQGAHCLGDLFIEALHEKTLQEEGIGGQKYQNSPEKNLALRNDTNFLPLEFESVVKKLAEGYYRSSTVESVCYLLEAQFTFDMQLKEGVSFMHKMALCSQVDAVSYMLKRGADPNLTTSINFTEFPEATLLHIAVAVGSLSIIAEATLLGAKISAQDANGNTPLHYAASLGQLELCSFFIEKGCPPDIKNKKRMEPIHAAILSDDTEVLDYFLDMLNDTHNPQITKEILEDTVARGLNSLMIAVENNSLDVFMHILHYNLDVNRTDAQGKTALHWAIELGRSEMMETLLIQGGSLRAKDNYGETPIFYAVRKGDLKLAERLFSFGSALNIESARGDTLLHTAAAIDNVEIIFWLLGKGLSPGKRNAFGQFPRDLAKSKVVRDLLPPTNQPVQFDIYGGGAPSFPNSEENKYSDDANSSPQLPSRQGGSRQDYNSGRDYDSQGVMSNNDDQTNAQGSRYSQQRSYNSPSLPLDSSPSQPYSRRDASAPRNQRSMPGGLGDSGSAFRDPRDTYHLSGSGNRSMVYGRSVTPMRDRLPTIKDRGNRSVNKGSTPYLDDRRDGGTRAPAQSYMNYLEEISKKGDTEGQSKSYNLPLIGKQNAL